MRAGTDPDLGFAKKSRQLRMDFWPARELSAFFVSTTYCYLLKVNRIITDRNIFLWQQNFKIKNLSAWLVWHWHEFKFFFKFQLQPKNSYSIPDISCTNQTVTVHLHSKYRILEHGRLNWVAEPVLNTDSKPILDTGNSEKRNLHEKTPRSLRKKKKKNC